MSTMKIKLFGWLRKAAGVKELYESGATVGEVLEKISKENEILGAAIFANESGHLLPHVRVMVNGVDSELKKGLETPVSDEDQIAIVPPIAGG